MQQAVYVPILKWKQGEYSALKELNVADKRLLSPIIEVVPIPTPLDEDAAPVDLDSHIAKLPKQVEANWGKSQEIRVDASLIQEPATMADGLHALDWILTSLRDLEIKAIPVVRHDSSQEALLAAKSAHEVDGRGICVRIDEEIGDDPQLLSSLDRLLSTLGVSAESVDLVLDTGCVGPSEVDRAAIACRHILERLPYSDRWRSLVLASSGFPENMAGQGVGISTIQRSDWLLWLKIKTDVESGRLSRLPIFGDYAIAHPELADIDPRTMQMSANIRYTSSETWVIYKGRGVRRYGFEQIYDLCTQLISSPCYRGKAFSFGDRIYYKRATEKDSHGKGNASQWRRDATNHHLTFVVRQITAGREPERED